MSHSPPRDFSVTKESSSQEDMNGSGLLVDMPTHNDEEDHFMSGDMPAEHTPTKQPQPQTQGVRSRSSQPQDANSGDERSMHAAAADQRRHQTRTPEPKQRSSQRVEVQPSPSTPGRLAPFDWEDFENRYQKALADADQQESDLLKEFEQLVKYFNVWAAVSSSHDNERAVKRLQTRTRYVHLSEEKLKQKKEHLSEVVKAFQSALALLSTA